MSVTNPMTIRCTACGSPVNTVVRVLLDVSDDPQGKALLLNGRLNQVDCPQCETRNNILAPILYHDPEKELLIAYIPMELKFNKDQEERAIGDLMRNLPKDNFRGYMFAPKRSLTMQGLIEQVLQADGVTPEMLERQRQRVLLAQQLVEAPEDQLDSRVAQHDAEIDRQFFQTLTMLAQRLAEAGEVESAQQVIVRQGMIAERSTAGQELIRAQEGQMRTIEEVAHALESLGDQATRADILDLAIRFQDDDTRLEALVGLARGAFDYQFFQEMTVRIGRSPATERDALDALRDRLVALTAQADQQAQAAAQNAVAFLQALINSPDPDAMIAENMPMIDDTFMNVLVANIREAERRGDLNASTVLRDVYERVLAALRDNMSAEMNFINQMLSADTDMDARQMLAQQSGQFDETLLDVMDAIGQALEQQDGDPALMARLSMLRQEAAALIGL
jgi:hypothetical protein